MRRTLVLGFTLLALAACTRPAAEPVPDSMSAFMPPPGAVEARVVRAVDGDTIVVRLDGRDQRLRYIGVNTPESVDPRREVQCFGKEAAERNRELVEGRQVWLEKDVSETDQYGRLLRYVYADGRLVNAALIREGYGRVVTFPPDVRLVDELRQLEREARTARRGLWGNCPA